MNKDVTKTLLLLVGIAVLLSGCGENAPSRDHFPVLKDQLYKLQVAVVEQNITAIDSLITPEAIRAERNADSLISFVNGASGDFVFARFGDYDIVYTNELGLISCYVMDSTGSRNRPIRLIYHYDNHEWRLDSFEIGSPEAEPEDSL